MGDVARVEDERRDRLGRGEAGPPSWLERSEAVEDCFFRLGVDLRLSSLNELELGVRRGVGCVWGWGCCCGVGWTPERTGKSDGDRSEEPRLPGETGAGIAASDGSFRRSEKMEGSMGGGGRGGVLEGVLVGAAVNGLEGSMAQKSDPFEYLCSKS